MNVKLQRWAERVLREVEAKDGTHVARIRMITPENGQCWDTWEGPPWVVEEWLALVDDLLEEQKREWPQRAIQVQFIAEDKGGVVRSQFAMSVSGTNRQALGFSSDQRAASQAMDDLAGTMRRVLETANQQLEHCQRIAQLNTATIEGQNRYIQLIQEEKALERQSQSNLSGLFEKAIVENLPVLAELLKSKISNGSGHNALVGLAQTAAAAVAPTPIPPKGNTS